MKLYFIKKVMLTLIVLSSITTYANDAGSPSRQHEAHVHGQAEINILIDESTFVFEVNSPTLNILGFEHEPHTEQEKAAVNQVNKMLLDYKSIVSIPGLNCEQSQNQITAPYGDAADEDDHHDHHHGEGHDDDHSEYYLFYSLSCKDIKNIKQINLNLFDNFPGFESVDLKWTYFNDAGSMEATKENKIIKIK